MWFIFSIPPLDTKEIVVAGAVTPLRKQLMGATASWQSDAVGDWGHRCTLGCSHTQQQYVTDSLFLNLFHVFVSFAQKCTTCCAAKDDIQCTYQVLSIKCIFHDIHHIFNRHPKKDMIRQGLAEGQRRYMYQSSLGDVYFSYYFRLFSDHCFTGILGRFSKFNPSFHFPDFL